MIRNYKAFGLALIAMCAIGAFAAQGASAIPLTVHGNPAPGTVFITGTNEAGTKHVFKSSGTVECNHSQFSATATTVSGAVSELTLTPEYKECVAFGFATAHVKHNGCVYTLTTPTDIGVNEVTWDTTKEPEKFPEKAQIHVICGAGKFIEITPTSFGVSVCTQKIGTHTPTEGHIIARNAAGSSPAHITDEVTVAGIHYTGTGGPCGTTGTNASYSGKTTIKCYSDKEHLKQVGCTVS